MGGDVKDTDTINRLFDALPSLECNMRQRNVTSIVPRPSIHLISRRDITSVDTEIGNTIPV